jgi:hypothetical protein
MPTEARSTVEEIKNEGISVRWRFVSRDDIRQSLVLFFFFFGAFAYFHHYLPGWNVSTRMDLTYSIVEFGKLDIDYYYNKQITETGDLAVFQGHYYCDKSPALSFTGVPFYAIQFYAREYMGFGRSWPELVWRQVSRYLTGLPTVCFPSALLGVLLWWMARGFGLSGNRAAVVSFALLCGTHLWGYATLYYAYLPACLCATACYAVLRSWRGEDDATALSRGPRLFVAGLLIGLAWYYEYTNGLVGIGLGVYALWRVRRRPWALWKFVLGGLIPVALLFAYTYHIFGEFSIPYKYEKDTLFREEMAKGFQGIHLPNWNVFYYIAVHPFRGLFFISPVLILWFAGVWRGLVVASNRKYLPDVLLSVYVVVAYFLFNSGYYLWWGGWATGPRFLCPAIPFFLVPLILFLKEGGKGRTFVFGLLLAVSFFWNFVIVATDPQVPLVDSKEVLFHATVSHDLTSPILVYCLPWFFEGRLALNVGNVLLRLDGLFSLVPLMAYWGLLAVYWRTIERRRGLLRSFHLFDGA